MPPRDWTDREIRAARHPGTAPGAKPVPVAFRVSDRLYLQVSPSGAKSWLARFMINGKARQMGLGAYDPKGGGTSLAEAREKVIDVKRELAAGRDPIATRRAANIPPAPAIVRTFEQVAELYIAAHEGGWRNAKHRQQWRNTLAEHAFPAFGAWPVETVDTGAITGVLTPLWQVRTETASRLRGRIEAVLDYATAHGWRTGENPARWRGHLAKLLPKRSKLRGVVHHPACAWREAGAFMAELDKHQGVAAGALRFAILTAARTGEVLGARWSEIDLAAKTWTVPAERMKGGEAHRVPLSPAALRVLREVAPLRDPDEANAVVFPALRGGRPLSAMALTMLMRRMNPDEDGKPARFRDAVSGRPVTVHGFRSTFRDWCAEAVAVPRDLAEAALAHKLRDKVEAAYQRADLLERRRALMDQWAKFLAKPQAAGKVVSMADARRRAGPQ